MRDFGEIIALAAERKGDLPALEDALAATPALAPSALAATEISRILAMSAGTITVDALR